MIYKRKKVKAAKIGMDLKWEGLVRKPPRHLADE